MNDGIQNLIETVERIAPHADLWETTAVIESLGLSDRMILREFGFKDSHALAHHISKQERPRHPESSSPPSGHRWYGAVREAGTFAAKFFSSFMYSLPWILMIILETRWPDALQVPPELAGLLSLALMASLITTGGFIQAIVRRGQFYMCMKEWELARRVSMLLVRMGCGVALFGASAGALLALYIGAFPSRYVAVAIVYYAVLCVLWLVCALLAVERRYVAILAAMSIAGGVYPILKMVLDLGPVVAHIGAACAAVMVASVGARRTLLATRGDAAGDEMDLPRRSVLLHSLAPYFAYGSGYFTFLFADRFCAGASIPVASGLFFGMEADYKRVMDAALVTFLVCAAVVEYLNHRFMERWYADAKERKMIEAERLSARLRTRYVVFCTVIAATSAVLGYVTAIALVDYRVLMLHRPLWLAGIAGYLLLSVALFNAVMLFSIRRPGAVVAALWPALIINITIGYAFSRAFGPDFAIVGLVFGASVFAFRSTRNALSALKAADYAYFAA